MVKVIALYQLVTELSEADSSLHARLDTVLSQHVIDSDVLPYITDKVQEVHVFEPVVVVDNACRIVPLKVQEFFQLTALPCQIFCQGILVQ